MDGFIHAHMHIHTHIHACNIFHLCILVILTYLQNGRTPLMEASCGGHVDVVKILIETDKQINMQDEV